MKFSVNSVTTLQVLLSIIIGSSRIVYVHGFVAVVTSRSKDSSTSPFHYLMMSQIGSNDDGDDDIDERRPIPSRRDVFRNALAVGAAAASSLFPQDNPVLAFDNKISNKYDDRPKRRGPQPKDLGIGKRMTLDGEEYVGLKSCGAAPNCFSSTITLDDDPDHSIPSWKWPSSIESQEVAFDELYQVLKSYQPGQDGVDGGGFEIKTYDPAKGYVYVVYEALKNGYYDDVEFAVLPNAAGSDREIQVRSSSRIGYLDFGVNGKRLNYIAKALRAKGWDAVGVDYKTHEFYAFENERR